MSPSILLIILMMLNLCLPLIATLCSKTVAIRKHNPHLGKAWETRKNHRSCKSIILIPSIIIMPLKLVSRRGRTRSSGPWINVTRRPPYPRSGRVCTLPTSAIPDVEKATVVHLPQVWTAETREQQKLTTRNRRQRRTQSTWAINGRGENFWQMTSASSRSHLR